MAQEKTKILCLYIKKLYIILKMAERTESARKNLQKCLKFLIDNENSVGYNYKVLCKRSSFFYLKGFLSETFGEWRFGLMEKYSSGRRGAPAKGVGRETGARVQIPPSPLLLFLRLREFKICKKNC